MLWSQQLVSQNRTEQARLSGEKQEQGPGLSPPVMHYLSIQPGHNLRLLFHLEIDAVKETYMLSTVQAL